MTQPIFNLDVMEPLLLDRYRLHKL